MKSMCCFRCSALKVGPVVFVVAALLLQGCDVPHVEGYFVIGNFDVKTHHVANWRKQPDYWERNSYKDPHTDVIGFNSCQNPMLTVVDVCSGHGKCMPIDPDNMEYPTYYCWCDPAWAGVECNHRRKSQLVAWVLSLFFGPLALDEVYLNLHEQALDKLFLVILGGIVALTHDSTVGGSLIAFAWLFDVARIGMSNVRAKDFRVEGDLSRFPFAVLTILYFCCVGFVVGLVLMYHQIIRKRRRSDMLDLYTTEKSPYV